MPTCYNHFTEMCSGSEAGSYLRRIDSCITQLQAQGFSRICNERKEEKEEEVGFGVGGGTHREEVSPTGGCVSYERGTPVLTPI